MSEKRSVQVESDILHPLAVLHWELCHRQWVQPRHCAVLDNTVVVLDYHQDKLHISSAGLHSWSTTSAPCYHSSLTTYQSKFVLVGGWYPSTNSPTDQLWASTTGLDWETSLPAMPTKRCWTSLVCGGLPEVLVVAGGQGSNHKTLNAVEVLLGDFWTTATSLPTPCYDMQSTLHEGNFYFTGGESMRNILYTCSCDSLIVSARKRKTTKSVWKTMKTPDNTYIIASYSSRLITIDEFCNISGYSNTTQTWLELTNVGNMPREETIYMSAAVLSTGQLMFANYGGVYRGTYSVLTFDPDTRFIPTVLSRLEAIMGVQIVSVLANYHTQLTTLSGVELKGQVDKSGCKIVMPDPESDAVLYVEKVIFQWCMGNSHRSPTWKQLLNVMQDIGLSELSQQIEAYMTGDYKFEVAYKHFIDSKDVLELLCLKFMFLGPPRLGKTTTRRRVMKEIIDLNSAEEADKVHGSTGAIECCPNMLVQDKPIPATAERLADWTIVQNLADEACLLFHSLKDSLENEFITEMGATSIVSSETKVEVSQASSTEQSRPVKKPSRSNLLQKMMSKIKTLTSSRQPRSVDLSAALSTHASPAPIVEASPDYSEVAAIFNEVSRQPKFVQDVRHSIKAFLRMEDTGGQPELMDMLPALTIGPALYLVFFSYEFKLDEEYQVFYQRDSGETTVPEKSEFTLKEMLLCMLASISCCSASTHAQPLTKSNNSEIDEILQSSRSVVYIVGTHKDKVDDDYIIAVDKQLQEIVLDTEFYKKGIVQFCSKDKLVVSLDNMGGGIEEIHQLHQLLENAMEKHFKKLRIPAVWLLFSLCLRMRGVRTASMKTCLALSNAFNMAPYETTIALWFLHHHAGVIMYFPNVPGLEDLVIIDIQVVYDSITGVILKAMSFDNTDHALAGSFRKTGCFTLKALKTATATISGDLIAPNALVALLAYVHIIAQILPKVSSNRSVLEEDKEYIMPCVLENTSSKELDLFHKESSRACFVVPLFIHFTCGFTPMGLFPAVMACLISNQSFLLTREGIKKNMVHFFYGSKQIHVTFISRSAYYEVIVSCDRAFHASIHIECAALRKEIQDTIEQASSRMNYSSYMDYKFAFECYSHKEENHLGIVYGVESIPSVMNCIKYPKAFALQKEHLIWYGQNYMKEHQSSEMCERENYLRVFLKVYPDLVNSVKPCVMTIADHCFSTKLISEDTYDELVELDSVQTEKQKARILLSNVRSVIATEPTTLNEFISVLLQSGECDPVCKKIQNLLHLSQAMGLSM